MYEQITSNKVKSFAMFVIFFIAVCALGFIIGMVWGRGKINGVTYGFIGLGIALIFAGIMGMVSYWQSDKVALSTSGAVPVENFLPDPNYIRYKNTVEGLALAAGVPVPAIYVIPSPAKNAFATGRNPEHSAVAATSGLITSMNDEQLQGVIAHEMSHIKNYEILLLSMVIILVGAVVLLSNIFLRSLWFGDNDSAGGDAGWILLVIGIVLAILTPVFAQLMKLAIGRKREYLADANGALLTRYPLGLASALEVLAADEQQMKTANQATAHLFIVQPLKTEKGSSGSWLHRMFDTHPPIEDRIARLQQMAGEFQPQQMPQQ